MNEGFFNIKTIYHMRIVPYFSEFVGAYRHHKVAAALSLVVLMLIPVLLIVFWKVEHRDAYISDRDRQRAELDSLVALRWGVSDEEFRRQISELDIERENILLSGQSEDHSL